MLYASLFSTLWTLGTMKIKALLEITVYLKKEEEEITVYLIFVSPGFPKFHWKVEYKIYYCIHHDNHSHDTRFWWTDNCTFPASQPVAITVLNFPFQWDLTEW